MLVFFAPATEWTRKEDQTTVRRRRKNVNWDPHMRKNEFKPVSFRVRQVREKTKEWKSTHYSGLQVPAMVQPSTMAHGRWNTSRHCGKLQPTDAPNCLQCEHLYVSSTTRRIGTTYTKEKRKGRRGKVVEEKKNNAWKERKKTRAKGRERESVQNIDSKIDKPAFENQRFLGRDYANANHRTKFHWSITNILHVHDFRVPEEPPIDHTNEREHWWGWFPLASFREEKVSKKEKEIYHHKPPGWHLHDHSYKKHSNHRGCPPRHAIHPNLSSRQLSELGLSDVDSVDLVVVALFGLTLHCL